MSLIEHFEEHFGVISKGWKDTHINNPIQVITFDKGPFENTRVLSTLGLSNYGLRSSVSDKIIFHELVLLLPLDLDPAKLVSVLFKVAEDAISNNKAYLRGDVIGPKGAIIDNSKLEALYVGIPVYFADSFHAYIEADKNIVFAWLVPITRREVQFIRENGWNRFEDKLEKHAPDLIDYYRETISG